MKMFHGGTVGMMSATVLAMAAVGGEYDSAVDVNCGRQLFVDDFLIAESSGLNRHWNRPVKNPDPVVWPAGGPDCPGLRDASL